MTGYRWALGRRPELGIVFGAVTRCVSRCGGGCHGQSERQRVAGG